MPVQMPIHIIAKNPVSNLYGDSTVIIEAVILT